MTRKRRIQNLERLYFPGRNEKKRSFLLEELMYYLKVYERYENLPPGSTVRIPAAYIRIRNKL